MQKELCFVYKSTEPFGKDITLILQWIPEINHVDPVIKNLDTEFHINEKREKKWFFNLLGWLRMQDWKLKLI